MTDTALKIAAGLEKAFAKHGFAQMGVDGLRDASQVSLRTLYKYCPSREAMILTALEYRHNRYLRYLFDALPSDPQIVLATIFDRLGLWMAENAPQGCLFKSAVAAYPDSTVLSELLERHKAEITQALVRNTGLIEKADELILLHEGITQTWPILGDRAVHSAKGLTDNWF